MHEQLSSVKEFCELCKWFIAFRILQRFALNGLF